MKSSTTGKKQTKKTGRSKMIAEIAALIVGALAITIIIFCIQSVKTAQQMMDSAEATLRNAALQINENDIEVENCWVMEGESLDARINVLGWIIDRAMEKGEPYSLGLLCAQGGFDAIGIYSSTTGEKLAGANVFVGEHANEYINEFLMDRSDFTLGSDEDSFLYLREILSDGNFLICRANCQRFQDMLDEYLSLEKVLAGVKGPGTMIAVDKKSGEILFAQTESSIKAGDVFKLSEDKRGYFIADNRIYGYVSVDVSANTALVMIIDRNTRVGSAEDVVLMTVLAFLFVMIILVFYSQYLREDMEKGILNKERKARVFGVEMNLEYVRKMGNMFVIGVGGVLVVSVFVQSLFALSNQRLLMDRAMEDMSGRIAVNELRSQRLGQLYEEDYAARAKLIAYALQKNPDRVDKEAATELAERARVLFMYVFDENGRTVATNTTYDDFALSTKQNMQSFEFWDVVHGYRQVLVQEPMKDDTFEHNYVQYIGVARQDAHGMVQIGVSPKEREEKLSSTKLTNVLSVAHLENDGFFFAVNEDSGRLLSWPEERQIDRNANLVGVQQKAIVDGFTGYQLLSGKEYFVISRRLNDNTLLYGAVVKNGIFKGCVSTAMVETLIGAAVLLASVLLIFRYPVRYGKGWRLRRMRWNSIENKRWRGVQTRFEDKIAEQKLREVVKILGGMVALYVVLRMRIIGGMLHFSRMVDFVRGRTWDHSPNLFAAAYCAMVAMEMVSLSILARFLISWFTQSLGAYTQTVGRLLENCIRYVCVIGTALYCLQFIGVNPAAILASAGVFTFAVSLGAQSLVADILAGIFIVFEGEFSVGDVVTIDGWRGVVEEIGIRTTKISTISVLQKDHDIKVFRNSLISGVVNMSNHPSIAICDIAIDYAESIEHVEEVLARELPHIRERVKDKFLEDPQYIGVSELGESGVVVRVAAYIEEEKMGSATRALNREVKMIFDRNGITVPFPQIVVSDRAEEQGD